MKDGKGEMDATIIVAVISSENETSEMSSAITWSTYYWCGHKYIRLLLQRKSVRQYSNPQNMSGDLPRTPLSKEATSQTMKEFKNS